MIKHLQIILTLKNSKLNMSRDYSKYLKTFNLPENSGGINIGDQKALYFLTKLYTPTKILELGTHIGYSTINFLMASKKNQNFENLTTVDIIDINDEKNFKLEKILFFIFSKRNV